MHLRLAPLIPERLAPFRVEGREPTFGRGLRQLPARLRGGLVGRDGKSGKNRINDRGGLSLLRSGRYPRSPLRPARLLAVPLFPPRLARLVFRARLTSGARSCRFRARTALKLSHAATDLVTHILGGLGLRPRGGF